MKQPQLLSCAVTAVPYPEWNPSYGDLLTMEEFLWYVESGMFIDYDGMGQWSDGMFTNTGGGPLDADYWDSPELEPSHLPAIAGDYFIYPSQIKKGIAVIPAWATHVVWYNK